MTTKPALKKWEVKAGKNRGLYIAVRDRAAAEPYFPEWGMLSDISSYSLKIRHSLPQSCIILTHSVWARNVMRPRWERVRVA